MLKLKQNILIVIVLILIYNNSYCANETDQENLNKITISTHKSCNKCIKCCFFYGIKHGVILSCVCVTPILLVLANTENNSKLLNKIKTSLPNINLQAIFLKSVVESLSMTLIQNTILHSSLEYGLSNIIPNKLSNKIVYKFLSAIDNYNIPIVKLFSKKILKNAKNHLSISATSTSCITEILTVLSISSFTISKFNDTSNIFTNIQRAILYILRISYYKSGGYLQASCYSFAAHIGYISSSILIFLFIYDFFLNTDISNYKN